MCQALFSNRICMILLFVFVFFITLMVYWPILQFEYVWDDNILFLNLNPQNNSLKDIFETTFRDHFFVSVNYYRPLVQLSFIFEMKYFNGDAGLSHLVNLSLHFFNACLLLIILNWKIPKENYFFRKFFILLGVSCYLLHPALSENVAWVSGRFDLMLSSFLLLALVFDCIEDRPFLRCIGVGLMFFLAALCKEMAVSFALVLPLWHLIMAKEYSLEERREKWNDNIKVYGSVIIFGLIYLSLRYFMLGYLVHFIEPENILDGGGWESKLAIFLKTFSLYFQQLLFPFISMSPMYDSGGSTIFGDPYAIAGFGGILFIVVGSFMRQIPLNVKIVVWGVILAFLPVLNLLPLEIGNNIIHNRFVIFPLCIGILFSCYSFSLFLKKSPLKWMRIFVIIFLAWISGAIFTLMTVVPLWRDDLSLWSWASLYSDSTATKVNFANELINVGRLDDALVEIEGITDHSHHTSSILSLKGDLHAGLGNIDQAIDLYERSILLYNTNSNLVASAVKLANLKMDKNEFTGVEVMLYKATQFMPNYARAYLALTRFHCLTGNNPEAAVYFSKLTLEKTVNKDQYNMMYSLLVSYGIDPKGMLDENAGLK